MLRNAETVLSAMYDLHYFKIDINRVRDGIWLLLVIRIFVGCLYIVSSLEIKT